MQDLVCWDSVSGILPLSLAHGQNFPLPHIFLEDSWQFWSHTRIPGGFLVYSWFYTRIPGTFLVPSYQDSWCILVHSWCIPGIFLVHSWCIPGTFYQDSLIRTIPAVLSYFNSFGCYGDQIMGQVEQPAGLAHGLPRVLVWIGYSVFHENPYPCDGSTGSSRVQTPLKMTSTVGFLSSAHHSKQTALLIKCFYVFVIMPWTTV